MSKANEALDRMAENARELGLDYEPEERYTYGTPLLDAFTKPAPVQEPFGYVWFTKHMEHRFTRMKPHPDMGAMNIKPIYTAPPGGRQSEDCLTAAQEDIQRLSALVRAQQITIDKLEQARSAPVQEPVATLWQHGETGRTRVTMPGDITDCDARWFKAADLYTTPPAAQRQWVGLTDEEVGDLSDFAYANDEEFVRNVEAKLREKNGGVV